MPEQRAIRRRGWWGVLPACLVVAAALTAASAAPASASPTFATGFTDQVYEFSSDPNFWFTRTRTAGAQLVLLPLYWARIEPKPPVAGTNPSDPANPAYDWSRLDVAVRDATAQGLTVALEVGAAGGPAWADGPGRPAGVQPGSWRPSATAFGALARAAAARYSGRFDAGSGVLPRVHLFEAWNEPNLSSYLTPQWTRAHGRYEPASPGIYRRLLNALYTNVKAVDSTNVVIAGATAPFGDFAGGRRMPPAQFVRELLCLRGRQLTSEPCPDRPRFDILAHHPYEIGDPFTRAAVHDDVSLPDMAKLTTPLRVAEGRGLVLPRGHKPVWVTEFSWDSSPPDPNGIPVMTRARWIDQAFWELWTEGVSAITWYLIADQAPVPSYAASYQSGMFFSDGRVKPGLTAFRFPFFAHRAGPGRSAVWGVAPGSGTVQVKVRVHSSWRTLFSVRVGAHDVFTRAIRTTGRTTVRATFNGEDSLAWTVG